MSFAMSFTYRPPHGTGLEPMPRRPLTDQPVAQTYYASDLLVRLDGLSAENLVTYHTLCLTHKVLRRGEPDVLADQLYHVAETRDRITRQNRDLYIIHSNTNMGKRRYACRAPKLYNKLPPELTRLPIPLFGKHLRQHLLEKQRIARLERGLD